MASGLLAAVTAGAARVGDHPSRITDEELWDNMDLRRPGLEALQAAVTKKDWDGAKRAWAQYFRTRQRPTMHFDHQTWAGFVREHLPQLVDPIIARAERICAGDITHGPFALRVENGQIKWLENPTTDTNYVSAVGSQWFLSALGRAYLLTGDERYADTFAWIFDSWYDHQIQIREHQGGLGFDPLFRAYYPGVRARILADTLYCCARGSTLTPDHHLKGAKALLGAAAWLYAQESPAYRKGNQQVAAVLGCGVVGVFLPEFRDSQTWIELAETRMRQHLQQDFFSDGGHKELCTQYHKAVLRDVGYMALLAEANGRDGLYSDAQAAPCLERAYDWLAKLVMPSGETPALHSAVFATDYAVHLELGARHFGRGDFAWLADRLWKRAETPSQKASYAFANDMLAPPPAGIGRPAPKPPCWLSTHLQASGFAVMRTGWETADRYLVAQYGWANTGHAYPAALHFIYEANGELVATAPGSPRSYRHPAYPYCHSTRSHNVVTIDGASCPGSPAAGGTLDFLGDLSGAWLFAAHHDGYKASFGVRVYRDILVIKDGPVLIRDRVSGGEGHEAQWGFHSPLAVIPAGEHSLELRGRGQYTLSAARPAEIVNQTAETHWMAVLPRDCQPGDCGTDVNVIRWHKPIPAHGASFVVALTEDRSTVRTVAANAYRIDARDRGWLVLFGNSEDGGAGQGVFARGRCVCVEWRRGKPAQAWAFAATSLTVDGREWLNRAGSVTEAMP